MKILALVPGRRLHREQLIDTLWPELTVDEAAPRLHKAAHYARRALGHPDSVVLAGEMVALWPDVDVQVDAAVFQAQAEAALAARDAAAAGSAADRYRGDLLPEDPYESWAQDVRDRLRMLYLDVLRLAGRWEVLTVVDPADERAHLELIAALARRGDRRAALRQFERLERALRAELGVAPSRAAEKLRERLLAERVRRIRRRPRNSPRPSLRRSILSAGIGSATDSKDWSPRCPPVAAGRCSSADRPASARPRSSAWLERHGAATGMRVGSGAAAQIEGAWPYAPVLEAVADLCRRHPALLDGLDDALREEIERSLSGRETAWRAQSGDQRLFVAVTKLVRLAAAGAGAVLVVDDAHDADDASARLIHYLARSTLDGPGADRHRAPAEALPGAGPGPAQPARPGQRRHPGHDHPGARRRGGAGSPARARGAGRADRRGVGGLGWAAVRGGGVGPDQRRRARHRVEQCCPPRCPPPRSTRWPRRPCSASPSTPTSSSR